MYMFFFSPSDVSASPTFDLIKKLIVKDPSSRLTADQGVDVATQLLSLM